MDRSLQRSLAQRLLALHDVRQPLNRSRTVARFHTPAALRELMTRDFDVELGKLGQLPLSQMLRPYQRLVWSESDDLPGVVVDQFGDTLVLQIQTLAMEKRSAVISDLLAELSGAQERQA